jgi:transcriptional regulator with XRE-family HTH domain
MPREEEIMEKISDLEILCENIKTLRVKNNLSEQEMAAKLKIGVKTLRNIEKGHFPRVCPAKYCSASNIILVFCHSICSSPSKINKNKEGRHTEKSACLPTTLCTIISLTTYAFFIVRRQREQTEMVLLLPPTEIFTLRMLGFQHLFVLRWEWETFSPNTTPLPQILHFAILDTSLNTPLWRTDIDLT